MSQEACWADSESIIEGDDRHEPIKEDFWGKRIYEIPAHFMIIRKENRGGEVVITLALESGSFDSREEYWGKEDARMWRGYFSWLKCILANFFHHFKLCFLPFNLVGNPDLPIHGAGPRASCFLSFQLEKTRCRTQKVLSNKKREYREDMEKKVIVQGLRSNRGAGKGSRQGKHQLPQVECVF